MHFSKICSDIMGKLSTSAVERDSSSDPQTKIKADKRRVIKNVIVICVSFGFGLSACKALEALQSSLHHTQGLGVINLSVAYFSYILSCLFLPKPIISRLGYKWTIPVCFSGIVMWIAANGYATWWTMIPASIYRGLCSAPLWTAHGSYLTKSARWYASLSGDQEVTVVARFSGIFFTFYQLFGMSGPLLSAFLLKHKSLPSFNHSRPVCGMDDCPWNNVSHVFSVNHPSPTMVWTLLGVFLAVSVSAILIVVVSLDKLPKQLREDSKVTRRDIGKSLTLTLRHMKQKKQCLLIFITMYLGFQKVFITSEWTKSFVSCNLGIWQVGYAMLAFSAMNTLVSAVVGYLTKYTGQLPIFTVGMLVDLSINVTLMCIPLSSHPVYAFYIISVLWGLTGAIWQTQIYALYGILFTNTEGAFANYRLWETVARFTGFAYSSFICTDTKLYLLTSWLLAGMVGYYTLNYTHNREQRRLYHVNLPDAHQQRSKQPKTPCIAHITITNMPDAGGAN